MEIHLDLLGGLAGDMFVAALLDAYPAWEPDVVEAVEAFSAAASPLRCATIAHHDGRFQGRRFEVIIPVVQTTSPQLHSHVTWRSIRERILGSALPRVAISHALGIFQCLAEAEGAVHGVAADAVSFHEVGAWDSIADIVGAAVLIEKLRATRWTCSAVPLGGGRSGSAHGVIPLPAPATARLLMGFPVIDDGIGGERVTPTGAAILRHLCAPHAAVYAPMGETKCLDATGFGFGTRKLPGISNCVRVLCFAVQASASPEGSRQIHKLEFEVDDQSGEDLAIGLDRLRTHQGVLDVIQSAVFGKKGRMMVHIQVLARSSHVQEVIDQCFRETTTIGLRRQIVHGVGLKRSIETATVAGRELRVKVVERPGGKTAKTESDDVAACAHHFRRARLRAAAEDLVLEPQDISADA